MTQRHSNKGSTCKGRTCKGSTCKRSARKGSAWEPARWRPIVVAVMFGALGAGALHAAVSLLPDAMRSLDRMMWAQALGDRPAARDLLDAAPVWRERVGASGDRIIERVAAHARSDRDAGPAIAVLEDVSGQALPQTVLAHQAAEPHVSARQVAPASFEALGAGDRLTITTVEGRVFAFEVVAKPDGRTEPDAEYGRFVIRMVPSGDGEPEAETVLQQIAPAHPHPAVDGQQHEL